LDLVLHACPETILHGRRTDGVGNGAQVRVRHDDTVSLGAAILRATEVAGNDEECRLARGAFRLLGAEGVGRIELRPLHTDEQAPATGTRPAGLEENVRAARAVRRAARAQRHRTPIDGHLGTSLLETIGQTDSDVRAAIEAAGIFQGDRH
jgi:hypothetical protein